MKAEIKDLFERAKNDDRSVRDEATLQIGMVLEKNSLAADKLDYYKSILEPQILSLALDKEEQKEIVAGLSQLIRTEKMTDSMLWILSKTSVIDALYSLLTWLQEYGHQAEEMAIKQAIGAIDKFLFVRIGGDKIYEHIEVAETIRNNNPVPILQMIANRKPEREAFRVPELAQELLDRIQQELYPPNHDSN